MNKAQFESYLQILTEPNQIFKRWMWGTAIGLQQVDLLDVSNYLYELAVANIEGRLSLNNVQHLLADHYSVNQYSAIKEADLVSSHIVELLVDNRFSMDTMQLLVVHKHLFKGIYNHAGEFRSYNISKREWILNDDTVTYASHQSLKVMIDYDLDRERNSQYAGLPMQTVIQHIARFIANLWQIHPFGEGNTRTTAVFLIKHLRTKGFDVTNDMFEKHSWYFRNALVRANYANSAKGVDETTEYLEKFLDNLLNGGDHVLSNRELKIKA